MKCKLLKLPASVIKRITDIYDRRGDDKDIEFLTNLLFENIDKRDIKIIALYDQGLSDEEIGDQGGMAEEYVRTRRNHVLRLPVHKKVDRRGHRWRQPVMEQSPRPAIESTLSPARGAQ